MKCSVNKLSVINNISIFKEF